LSVSQATPTDVAAVETVTKHFLRESLGMLLVLDRGVAEFARG